MIEICSGVSTSSYSLSATCHMNDSLAPDNVVDATEMDSNIHPKDYWLRVDHQTFRKLPKSKGIIFGV